MNAHRKCCCAGKCCMPMPVQNFNCAAECRDGIDQDTCENVYQGTFSHDNNCWDVDRCVPHGACCRPMVGCPIMDECVYVSALECANTGGVWGGPCATNCEPECLNGEIVKVGSLGGPYAILQVAHTYYVGSNFCAPRITPVTRTKVTMPVGVIDNLAPRNICAYYRTNRCCGPAVPNELQYIHTNFNGSHSLPIALNFGQVLWHISRGCNSLIARCSGQYVFISPCDNLGCYPPYNSSDFQTCECNPKPPPNPEPCRTTCTPSTPTGHCVSSAFHITYPSDAQHDHLIDVLPTHLIGSISLTIQLNGITGLTTAQMLAIQTTGLAPYVAGASSIVGSANMVCGGVHSDFSCICYTTLNNDTFDINYIPLIGPINFINNQFVMQVPSYVEGHNAYSYPAQCCAGGDVDDTYVTHPSYPLFIGGIP